MDSSERCKRPAGDPKLLSSVMWVRWQEDLFTKASTSEGKASGALPGGGTVSIKMEKRGQSNVLKDPDQYFERKGKELQVF